MGAGEPWPAGKKQERPVSHPCPPLLPEGFFGGSERGRAGLAKFNDFVEIKLRFIFPRISHRIAYKLYAVQDFVKSAVRMPANPGLDWWFEESCTIRCKVHIVFFILGILGVNQLITW